MNTSTKISRAVEKFMHGGRTTLEIAAEALWPTRCSCCDKPGNILCTSCLQALPFIDVYRACPRCGAAFGRIQCCECNPIMLAAGNRDTLPFKRMASAVILNENTRRIVTAYKDAGEQRLADVIATMMSHYVPPEWQSVPITYIPATSTALRRRGFDHAELLANYLARHLDTTVHALFERPRTHDQRKLSRQARMSNMGHSFSLIEEAPIPHTLMVIDDVCTTGATLYAAADALMSKGAHTLFGLTFARA